MYYFPDPTNVGCFFRFLSPSDPSADPTYINISTNGKQDVLKQPEANTDLLYFSVMSYYPFLVQSALLGWFGG